MTPNAIAPRNKWLRWLPGVLISALAVYAVIRFADIQDFREAIVSVTPVFVISIAVLTILSLVVRAIAWRTILGNQVSFSTSFFGISEGYFLNNILPFRAGEIGRALLVGRSSNLGTVHVLSTVFIERAIDILYAAGIILLTIPLVIGSEWIKSIAFTAFIAVVLGLILLFFIAKNRNKTQQWIDQKRNSRSRFVQWLLPQINKIMDGMSALVKPSQFLLSVFWIGVCWVVWTVLYYTAIVQLAPTAPLWWGAFVGSLLALGVAIPSAPAAVGIFEASMVGALAILGISSGSALAYAIILHISQVLFSILFGVWGLIRDGQRISSILQIVFDKRKIDQYHA